MIFQWGGVRAPVPPLDPLMLVTVTLHIFHNQGSATNASLTADPGVASSIPARFNTFVEIDHEIISTVILLPSAESSVPALGKDKKTNSRTSVARWSQVDPRRHCNVKMTSPCHISANSGFPCSFFFMPFQYKMRHLVVSKKKNPFFV